jgi:chromosome segregation ATPase
VANLQESARQLVEQIAELDADVAGASGTLERLRQRLRDVEKELDERIEELEKEVGEFAARVEQETRQLSTDLDQADEAMTGAREAVDGARTEAESAIEAGRQAAQAVADTVDDVPEALDQMVSAQADEAAAALGRQARAAASAVEEALDLTSDNVAALTESLVELQQQIPSAAQGVGKAIETADEHLGEAFVAWTSRLFEVVDLVKNEGFEPALANAEEVAGYALDQCREGVDETVQEAFDRMAELARDFEALEQAIGQEARQVTDQGEPLVSELSDLRNALTAAMGWLETVEEWLGSYTFMKA